MSKAYFIGIDVGTQGARIVLVDERGQQIGAKEEVFKLDSTSREEQDPGQWWLSCIRSLTTLCQELKDSIELKRVKSIAVTSTSGTIIPIDKDHSPIHRAIMYSDNRSKEEALVCQEMANASAANGYTAFNSSSGLPKMLWFIKNYPDKVHSIHRFIHAADFMTGMLSGNFDVTDFTNVLKSGYDLHNFCWPEYIFSNLGIQKNWLQDVVPSGTAIGKLKKDLAHSLGLSSEVIISAGITDGCASQVASGAVNPGDWNTTIGTTLVVKGVTHQEINDPTGAIYSHRHPKGYWMPGGASNTGADWISRLFPNADLNLFEKTTAELIPTKHLAWPLMQTGERFPFVAPQATGFSPEGLGQEELFTAYLEGVAYIERYAYEKIKSLSGETITRVFSAGGGSNNDTWMGIRSTVLGLPVCKMKNLSGAAGAAIVAASKTYFDSVTEAASQMVKPEKTFHPELSMINQYETNYIAFIDLLRKKNYLDV